MFLARSALTCWFLSEQSGFKAGNMYSGKTLASDGGTESTALRQECRERTAHILTAGNGSDSMIICIKEKKMNSVRKITKRAYI